jgi:ADP-heptose:LPS heptosyltransferase
MSQDESKRILVYRLGSIGDTIVSLPCFHLIRRCYPAAEIVLLTNEPQDSRAAPAENVLAGTGLVDRYMSYPLRTRSVDILSGLRRSIRSFNPGLMIYMVSRPTSLLVWRDYLFFRFAGVKRGLGFPFLPDQRKTRPPASAEGLWESEADRLARCLQELGSAETARPESWDLHLSRDEKLRADKLLDLPDKNSGAPARYIGLSIGTKQPQKDWGDANWRRVLLGLRNRDIGLILIGGKEDSLRSVEVAKGWLGPVINLCGKAGLRESAAAMRHMEIFLCHDSGPMHLAASVNTRCVALFSNKNKPGQWFPFGAGHQIFYPPSDAASIRAIRARDIIETVSRLLAQSGVRAESRA